jgi:hypothetical protein
MRMILAVIGIALALATTNGASAAGGNVWQGGFADGCAYLGQPNTGVYILRACPRADGAYDLYLPNVAGQWIYSAIGVWDRFSCATIWDGTSTYGPICPGDASIGASKGQTTVYADGTVITVPDLGDGNSVRGPVLTGNPVIDAINTTASARDTGVWVASRCQPVSSTTCVLLP